MVKTIDREEHPVLLAVTSLGLKPKVIAVLAKAAATSFIFADEIKSIIPGRILGDDDARKRVVAWLTETCQSLGIVILPARSKSRIERAIRSGEAIYSYQAPITERDFRKKKPASQLASVTRDEAEEGEVSENFADPDPEELGEIEESPLETLVESVHKGFVPEKDTLSFCLKMVGSYKVLSHEQTLGLAQLIQEHNDVEARNTLVLHNLRMAVMVARRYRGRGLDFLDLIQEGVKGLMSAADRYDPTRGFKFMTYAMWWVRSTIVRAIYLYGETIRVPVQKREDWTKIVIASAKLVQELGREPTAEEIAVRVSRSIKGVEADLHQMRMTTVYLDDLLYDGEDEAQDSFGLFAAKEGQALDPEEQLEAEERFEKVCNGLQRFLIRLFVFPERDQVIFRLRYGLDGSFEPKTLEEVGHILSRTRERIRQIQDRVWRQLSLRGVVEDEHWLVGEVYKLRLLGELVDKDVVELLDGKYLLTEFPAVVRAVEAEKKNGQTVWLRLVQKVQPIEPPVRVETLAEKKPDRTFVLQEVHIEGTAPEQIIQAVCDVFNVSRHIILGDSRIGRIVLARHVLMSLMRTDLKKSLPEIGKVVNRDHTSVMHGCDRIETDLKKNKWLQEQIVATRARYAKKEQ